ncbi:MAG: hypothetical protein LKJ83_00040 [Eubacteriaceae bacterium]|nr:hypothetical protein [Eubacteriaceae bacterium]
METRFGGVCKRTGAVIFAAVVIMFAVLNIIADTDDSVSAEAVSVTQSSEAQITKDEATYMMTGMDGNSGTVAFNSYVGQGSYATVPASIIVNSHKMKVTKIMAAAFSGEEAAGLKTIVIRSRVISEVEKGAFSGISAGTVIKVPFSKLSEYTAMIEAAGVRDDTTVIGY